MQRLRPLGRVALLLVAATALGGGCNGPTDDLPRQAVSGTVNLDGQPLKEGMIQFQPTDPGNATAGGAGIADGSYSVPKADGLAPGKYSVTISSTPAPTAPAGLPGDPVPPPKEKIPPQYNAKTTLSATVTKEGPNDKIDFDLKSK